MLSSSKLALIKPALPLVRWRWAPLDFGGLCQVAGTANVPAMLDVIAGHIPFMMTDIHPALPHIHDGKVRVLGVTTPHRVAAVLEVPTLAESGRSSFELVSWQGVGWPCRHASTD